MPSCLLYDTFYRFLMMSELAFVSSMKKQKETVSAPPEECRANSYASGIGTEVQRKNQEQHTGFSSPISASYQLARIE